MSLRTRDHRLLALILKEYQNRGFLALRQEQHFAGLSDEEIFSRLTSARENLAASGILATIAAFEAVLRVDLNFRVSRAGKNKARINETLFELYKKSSGRVRLDDLLDSWRDEAIVRAGSISALKPIYAHRHWIAHGGYWTNKSGIALSVDSTLQAWTDAQQAFLSIDPQFPRVV